MSDELCVIVGAGHTAAQVVASLVQEGWAGKICLVGEEPYLPYNRPPLSKTFLSGAKGVDELLIRPAAAYEKFGVECRLNTRVEKIDTEQCQLHLSDDEVLSYKKLVLCTGGSPRLLKIPGHDLDGVHYLRSIDDVDAIRKDTQQYRNVVIIGGGYVGLETAAMMRQLGLEVTVLEAAERLLSRVTAPQMSSFFQALHEHHGVKVVTSAHVSSLSGNGRVSQVHCEDGQIFDADLVIVGIGIIPNTRIAEEAGLLVENGIVVDEACQTSDPHIVAAGDCTQFNSHHYARPMRLESVQNAVDQAKVAAATLCGKQKAHQELPWFWSDQYDIKFQIAGLSEGYSDVVIRGEPEVDATPDTKADATKRCKFAAFYLKNDQVLAVDAVNSPQDFMFGKRLILARSKVEKDNLSDLSVSLKTLLPG